MNVIGWIINFFKKIIDVTAVQHQTGEEYFNFNLIPAIKYYNRCGFVKNQDHRDKIKKKHYENKMSKKKL